MAEVLVVQIGGDVMVIDVADVPGEVDVFVSGIAGLASVSVTYALTEVVPFADVGPGDVADTLIEGENEALAFGVMRKAEA